MIIILFAWCSDNGCDLMASLHPATPTSKTYTKYYGVTVPTPTPRPSYATPILTTPLLESTRFINLAHIYKYGPDINRRVYKYGTDI